jgi:hypothetical protein
MQVTNSRVICYDSGTSHRETPCVTLMVQWIDADERHMKALSRIYNSI